MFLPGGCGRFMYPSVGMGWRHSGQWGDPASRERQRDKHLLIPSVRHRVPAASDSLCHLLSGKHSNWAKPGALCGVNRHFFQVIFQITPRCVGVVGRAVCRGGASLVALKRCAVNTVCWYPHCTSLKCNANTGIIFHCAWPMRSEKNPPLFALPQFTMHWQYRGLYHILLQG